MSHFTSKSVKGLLVVCLWLLSVATSLASNAVGDVITEAYTDTYLKNRTQSGLVFIIDKTSTGSSFYKLGEVEVKAADGSTLTGKLSIPAVIYIKIGTTICGYNVVKISDKAFQNQTGITRLEFALGLLNDSEIKYIGSRAFYGCTGLTGIIDIRKSVDEIGSEAFACDATAGKVETARVLLQSDYDGLKMGENVFGGRQIRAVDILNNFASKYSGSELFGDNAVDTLNYFGNDYYNFKTTYEAKTGKTTASIGGYKVLGLPRYYLKAFIDTCQMKSRTDLIPDQTICISFYRWVGDVYCEFQVTEVVGSYYCALHKIGAHGAAITVEDIDIDMLDTHSGFTCQLRGIDSGAFADDGTLESITFDEFKSGNSLLFHGNAFEGANGLRYVDLTNVAVQNTDNFTASRVPTTTLNTTRPYEAVKGSDGTVTYKYNVDDTQPLGGLPPYTLVYMPKTIEKVPAGDDEPIYTNGSATTGYTRPVDENTIITNGGANTCGHFGIYDVSSLDTKMAAGGKYTWYTYYVPTAFTAANCRYHRMFSPVANGEGGTSVSLPFKPDADASAGRFYEFGTNDGKTVSLNLVTSPQANTPYFYFPDKEGELTSSTSQEIAAVSKEQTESFAVPATTGDGLYGVYAGTNIMSDASTAVYAMSAKAFTNNGKQYPAGTFVKITSATAVNPFRAYLKLSQAAGAKASVLSLFRDDTTTGIEGAEQNGENAKDGYWYNMQGCRVEHPGHGLYIHNGKKVIMK